MGRHSNLANYGRHGYIRHDAISAIFFIEHALDRARHRLRLSRRAAERDCRDAILITLLRGPLPDSGDRTGHKLARGRRGLWLVSFEAGLGWIVHSVLPAQNFTMRRGKGRWWVVRRIASDDLASRGSKAVPGRP